jgi:hypothetical protein
LTPLKSGEIADAGACGPLYIARGAGFGVREFMNLIDRDFAAAGRAEAPALERARTLRRRKIALGIGLALVVVAAVSFYVWATTLCGDCGGPSLLPPPPA